MHTLDARQVDRAWQRTSRLPPAAARQAMHNFAQTHPTLLAFVLATTEDLGAPAQSLANVLFFQIARTFVQTVGDDNLPHVDEEQLAQLFERNLEILGDDAEEEEGDPWTAGSGQPHLLRRVLETLFDAPNHLDGAEVSEDEVSQLFLVLKTVVDALDGDAEPPDDPS